MDISIVIVNYRGWAYLEPCLAALELFQGDCFSLEVVVIDNCSGDGRLEQFQVRFPKVKFVLNTGNNGFSNGCNLGASLSRGTYLLFMNPDIVVTEAAVCGLLDNLKEKPEITILSCGQVNRKGKKEQVFRFFPSVFTVNGLVRAVYRKIRQTPVAELSGENNSLVYPDWVSGSLVFISKENFERIGGWCEDYWLYYEDVDLCWQARKLGGEVALNQDICVMHNHGGTTRINLQTAALTKSEVIISLHVFVARNYPPMKAWWLHLLIIIATMGGKLIPAFLGVPLFFVDRLKLYRIIFVRLLKYYHKVMHTGNWLSERSVRRGAY